MLKIEILKIVKSSNQYVFLLGEESEEGGVDAVDDGGEVCGLVLEVEVVDVDGEHSAPVFLVDEFLVELVQSLEVVDGYGLLVVPSPLLDVLYEVWHRRAQVDHQVGVAHDFCHLLEEFHVGVEVPVAEVSHGAVVGGEDIHSLIDASVLYL